MRGLAVSGNYVRSVIYKFDPDGSVTRVQMAAIAYRWIQEECKNDASAYDSCGKLETTSKGSYKDVPAKHWAIEAINFLQATNIMVGGGNETSVQRRNSQEQRL